MSLRSISPVLAGRDSISGCSVSGVGTFISARAQGTPPKGNGPGGGRSLSGVNGPALTCGTDLRYRILEFELRVSWALVVW